MVALSSVTTPSINLGQSREQFGVRDDSSAKERLFSTKPAGTASAKSENSEQKNYQDQTKTFDAAQLRAAADSSAPLGNRRGSLLDLSV